MNPVYSRTYREYSDSSEDQIEMIKKVPKMKKHEEDQFFQMDKQEIIQLLLDTRKEMKYYAQANRQAKSKLKKITKLYSDCLDQLSEYKRVDKAQPKQRNAKVGKQNFDFNRNDIPSSKTLTSRHVDKQTSNFKRLIFKQLHTDQQQQCFERIKKLKDYSKFVCNLYNLIDNHTNQSYFNSQYSLSGCWEFIIQILNSEIQQGIDAQNMQQIAKLLNCQSKDVIQALEQQIKQLRFLRDVVELIRKDNPSLLKCIYAYTKFCDVSQN